MGRKKEPDGLDEWEAKRQKVLESVLEYVVPGGGAEKACASLLKTLGSFDGVFAAPEEVLRDIPAVGPETARFLSLVVQMCRFCLEERSWQFQRIYDTASAVEVFRPKFLGRKTEAVCLMLLDGRGRVVYNDLICEGSVSQVPLYLRKVLQLCIQYHVDDVILAHNHPSGVPFPSHNDLVVTDRLLTALQGIGADLEDHIILADDSYYSFLDSGALADQRLLLREAQARELESTRQLELRLQGLGGGKK